MGERAEIDRIEVFQASDGKWYWRVLVEGGEVTAESLPFSTKENAQANVVSLYTGVEVREV